MKNRMRGISRRSAKIFPNTKVLPKTPPKGCFRLRLSALGFALGKILFRGATGFDHPVDASSNAQSAQLGRTATIAIRDIGAHLSATHFLLHATHLHAALESAQEGVEALSWLSLDFIHVFHLQIFTVSAQYRPFFNRSRSGGRLRPHLFFQRKASVFLSIFTTIHIVIMRGFHSVLQSTIRTVVQTSFGITIHTERGTPLIRQCFK